MSTYTSNYGWTKPSGSDNVDISVLNNNLDDQDSTIHDAFLNMAPPFSESSTYAVDDIVLYGTGLYKCHTAVVTPGSWTGSTNWQVYKLSEGGSGGGGTSDYNPLTNKPQINGVTLSGNKTTSDLGIDKNAVGLGNVPNVSTNDQTPTFSEASTRNNIASGEKLSVIFGKIQKFFNDLKTVAFSGSFSDLSNKPENANTFQGTIAEWNQLTTAEKKAYDHASITGTGGGEYNVDKSTGDLVQTSGMPSEYPATQVMMSDDVTSVEDAIDGLTVVKIDEAAANQTYQKQLTDLTNSYNSLSDRQKQRAYIMVGTTKFITISAEGQFMHHDAGGSGLVATTLNCITHTAYNVNSSSVTSIGSNTNTNTMALYA